MFEIATSGAFLAPVDADPYCRRRRELAFAAIQPAVRLSRAIDSVEHPADVMRFDALRPPQSNELHRDDADDQAWIAQVRRGDRRAFELIYRSYYQALVGFVYNYLRSEALAEDEVQELFLAIWRHRERWEPRSTLRAYLFKGARNRALNRLRHEGVTSAACESAVAENRTIAMGEAPADLDLQAEADELAVAAQQAIIRLPPRCRMAFTLCRAHGMSYAEAAQVMGISEHTVKIQMTRALRALRAGLAHWLP